MIWEWWEMYFSKSWTMMFSDFHKCPTIMIILLIYMLMFPLHLIIHCKFDSFWDSYMLYDSTAINPRPDLSTFILKKWDWLMFSNNCNVSLLLSTWNSFYDKTERWQFHTNDIVFFIHFLKGVLYNVNFPYSRTLTHMIHIIQVHVFSNHETW